MQTGGARDFFKSLAETAAICRHHVAASKTFLTRKAFVDMAGRSRWFDTVMVEQAAAFYHVPARLAHLAALRREKFTHVYVLSDTPLSFAERVALKGAQIVFGSADIVAVLSENGVDITPPDMGWLQNDVSFFGMQKPYVLLLPGADGWSAVRYAATAMKLMRDGYDVALLGTDAETLRLSKIERGAPGVKNFCGRTSFYDIAGLARDADGVIGMQSGAVQLAALLNAPVVAFLQGHDNPETDAPQGTAVTVIQADDMTDVTVEDVLRNLRPRPSMARESKA